jgi:DNA-binding Lrp family transcriptional regulator
MKAKLQKPQTTIRSGANKRAQLKPLRSTDRAVLLYLNQLCREKEDSTCTVSFPTIADACDISERQAQISTGRLIKAGLLKRIGYDFGNVVRSCRGTKYKLLKPLTEVSYTIEAARIEKAVQMLLQRQDIIESHLKQLTLKQDGLLSMVTDLVGKTGNVKSSNRP